MKLAIFTHVIHEEYEGKLHAYSPYVREINLWVKYFDKVELVAPLRSRSNKILGRNSIGEKFFHHNLKCTIIPSFNILTLESVVKSSVKIPFIFYKIFGAMSRADHLHIRCPGNIGLIAVISQIFFPYKPKTVKYAGNWDPKSKQPWTYKLQKWIISNTFLSRNIKVLVYGKWKNHNENILPFFTASFSKEEREFIIKDFQPPYRFIYTGNLVQGKGLKETIFLIKSLKQEGLKCKLEIYGDGILESELRQMVEKLDLQNNIIFKGRVTLQILKQAYRKAHFSFLLSKSEGWPKALAEAMFFGCIPVATPVSCVPWMLGEGKRGIMINPEKNSAFHEIRKALTNPEKFQGMSMEAQQWAQFYTLEKFRDEIEKLL
jgi:glycosyltransferase involved in cell wall biosynthesis